MAPRHWLIGYQKKEVEGAAQKGPEDRAVAEMPEARLEVIG